MSNERASFTAGPWSQYHDDPLVIVNANGSSLGEASAGDPFISYSEQLANARLIAAAPQLLAALEAAKFLIESDIPDPEDCGTYHAVLAAIVAAKGQL